jgi:hypothetical protein
VVEVGGDQDSRRLSSWKHNFTALSPKRRFLELAMLVFRSSSRNLATFSRGTLVYSLLAIGAYEAMSLHLLILRCLAKEPKSVSRRSLLLSHFRRSTASGFPHYRTKDKTKELYIVTNSENIKSE